MSRMSGRTLSIGGVWFARVEIYWYRLHALTTCRLKGHKWTENALFYESWSCERCGTYKEAVPRRERVA